MPLFFYISVSVSPCMFPCSKKHLVRAYVDTILMTLDTNWQLYLCKQAGQATFLGQHDETKSPYFRYFLAF